MKRQFRVEVPQQRPAFAARLSGPCSVNSGLMPDAMGYWMRPSQSIEAWS